MPSLSRSWTTDFDRYFALEKLIHGFNAALVRASGLEGLLSALTWTVRTAIGRRCQDTGARTRRVCVWRTGRGHGHRSADMGHEFANGQKEGSQGEVGKQETKSRCCHFPMVVLSRAESSGFKWKCPASMEHRIVDACGRPNAVTGLIRRAAPHVIGGLALLERASKPLGL